MTCIVVQLNTSRMLTCEYVAESYWKVAKNLDSLGDYDGAARKFEMPLLLQIAGQKISQFSDFYLGYASYMKAWSEVEIGKAAQEEENLDVRRSNMGNHRSSSGNLGLDIYVFNFDAWSFLCTRRGVEP